MMRVGFYGVLPATVRYDKELRPLVRLLYAEISASIDFKRECAQDNAYFARLLDVSKTTVQQYVRQLVARGHITSTRRGRELILSIPAEIVYVKEKVSAKTPFVDVSAISNKAIINEVINKWNQLNKSRLKFHVKKTKDLEQLVTERLESFSKEDILSALISRHALCELSEWHQREENVHHATNINMVLGSDDKLTKCLNMALKPSNKVDFKKDTVEFKTGNMDTNLLK